MAVGIGCLFMLVFSLDSCKKKVATKKKFSGSELNVDEANIVDAYMSNGGKMKARLRAPQMLSFSDSSFRIEFPKTMHVDFFNDSSVIESQLDSRKGTYYESQSKVFLKDSVRVFNVVGDTLFANELWWDQRSQEFYTDKPVRVHRPTMIMVGVGLKAPQDFKMFEMYKITNSILRVKDLGEVVSPGDSAAVPSNSVPANSAAASVNSAPVKSVGVPVNSMSTNSNTVKAKSLPNKTAGVPVNNMSEKSAAVRANSMPVKLAAARMNSVPPKSAAIRAKNNRVNKILKPE